MSPVSPLCPQGGTGPGRGWGRARAELGALSGALPAVGTAGVMVSLSRILTKLLLPDERASTLIFFLVSAGLELLCFLLHLLVRRSRFVLYHTARPRDSRPGCRAGYRVHHDVAAGDVHFVSLPGPPPPGPVCGLHHPAASGSFPRGLLYSVDPGFVLVPWHRVCVARVPAGRPPGAMLGGGAPSSGSSEDGGAGPGAPGGRGQGMEFSKRGSVGSPSPGSVWETLP